MGLAELGLARHLRGVGVPRRRRGRRSPRADGGPRRPPGSRWRSSSPPCRWSAWCSAGPVALRVDRGSGPDSRIRDVTDVLQGTWTAWGELLTTLPWVDLDGRPGAGALPARVPRRRARGRAGAAHPECRRAVLPLLVACWWSRCCCGVPGGTGSAVLDWYPVAFAGRGDRLAGGARACGSRRAPTARGAGHGRVARALVAVARRGRGDARGGAAHRAAHCRGGPASRWHSPCAGTRHALSDLSGLDSPLRRFRTFTDQGEGSLDERPRQGAVHRDAVPPQGSRVRMVTLDRTTVTSGCPATTAIPGASDDAFLRLDSPGRQPDVQGRADPGPGDR